MRWMSALLVFAGFSTCLGAPLAAQDAAQPTPAPSLQVRQSADPKTGIVVGQHVAVFVDVLFPGEMAHPPRVSLPDVPGLQIFRFESQGTTLRDTIAGTTYVGQRFEFALYARRGGAFDILPASVTLLDRQGGETGNAQGQAVHLDVTVPPGVDVSQPVVAARGLTLNEQWEPLPTGHFKAGDAITRTIVRSAEDMPGLAMRDLAFPAPEGVRIYADPPDIDDHSNRGVVTGRRTDRVTYVFERGGTFELPVVTQPWWDLGARRLNTATAPGATVNVEAIAAPAQNGAHRHWTVKNLLWPALGFIALIPLAWGVWHLLRHIEAGRTNPERVAFMALRHACQSADAREIFRRFSSWAACLPPQQRNAANRETADLQAALFAGGTESWSNEDSRRLLARLDPFRRPRVTESALSALPPLNPPLPTSPEVGRR